MVFFLCFASTIGTNDSSMNGQDCVKCSVTNSSRALQYRLSSNTAESYDEGFHLEWNQASGVIEVGSLHGYSTGSDSGF